MPEYTYKCKCEKIKTITRKMSDVTEVICDCGDIMIRDFSRINFDNTVEKRDINHKNSWKVGKSAQEVSTYLSNVKKQPY